MNYSSFTKHLFKRHSYFAKLQL